MSPVRDVLVIDFAWILDAARGGIHKHSYFLRDEMRQEQ
jgi:hypothetical protein